MVMEWAAAVREVKPRPVRTPDVENVPVKFWI